MGLSAERQAVVDTARSFIGVKWRHQGRSREFGLDCVGLPLLVGMELGYMNVSLKPANYPRRPDSTFIPLFREYLDFVKPADAKDGDILVFADGGYPCHCGFLATLDGVPTVIHSHAMDRAVVESQLEVVTPSLGKPVFRFKFRGLT